MPKYIDANELDTQISRKQPPLDMRAKEKEGFKTALLSVRSMIHSAYSADVQEVKHGRWEYDIDYATCSCCKKYVCQYDDDGNRQNFCYCPNCGAIMDCDENGNEQVVCENNDLDEAIEYINEELEENDILMCEDCRKDLVQMRAWLIELKARREGEEINDE